MGLRSLLIFGKGEKIMVGSNKVDRNGRTVDVYLQAGRFLGVLPVILMENTAADNAGPLRNTCEELDFFPSGAYRNLKWELNNMYAL